MTAEQMTSVTDLIAASQANVVTAGVAVMGITLAVLGFKWIKRAFT
jgi:hypothetical protein